MTTLYALRKLLSVSVPLYCSLTAAAGLRTNLFNTIRGGPRYSTKMSNFDGANQLVVDPFCLRQFNNPDYTGSQINYSVEEFERRVNEIYNAANGPSLVDGYAPFCKHVFIPNFVDMDCGYMEQSEENKHLIESCYEARTDKELPVLIQYVDRKNQDVKVPKATFLDVILYSREHIIKENKAMGSTPPASDAPWGIISVKGQLCDYELPMQPITIMRNALGKEHGGSGVPLDFDKYTQSVNFWKKHVAIK